MKYLKIIIPILFLTILASCTDLELEENPDQIAIENASATGGESDTVDDGSKD